MKKQPMNMHRYSQEVDKPSNLSHLDKAIFILAGIGLVAVLAAVFTLIVNFFN